MFARKIRRAPCERANTVRPYGFVRYLFVYANSPINQNLNGKLMFIGVLWLRRKRTKPSNTVGVDVPGDPKTTKFDFVHGYVQTLITKGFHQFYNCKSFRFGAPRTSPPTRFVCRHFVTSNTPTNQNLLHPYEARNRFVIEVA